MIFSRNKLSSFLLTLVLAMALSTAYADSLLDESHSSISFVSVKKGTVAEVNIIKKMSGTLSDKGELKVVLDLTSVDSKIVVRDERMVKHLFETDKFATATITATIELPTEEGMSKLSAEGTLDLHGVSKPIKVDVMVVKTGDKLLATSLSPIIIKAEDFGMVKGVAMLQALAKLPSIATAVPVNFVLVFANKDK
ncbi:MAG: YceI family protein [Thiotrichaceae bacterium]|nr:YceI family protein [Thiotrichaceae bacterium]